jgi:hypothetical protein
MSPDDGIRSDGGPRDGEEELTAFSDEEIRTLVLLYANTVTLSSAPSPWMGEGRGEGARRAAVRSPPSPKPSPTEGRGDRNGVSEEYVTVITTQST